MAVTVLKHIKEAKNRAAAAHLKNAIQYIVNPEKTAGGLWVGGNVGKDPDEVFRAMMDTKADYGKFEGRQGYHYVISFAPGETDTETTYLIGKEFCKRYLGDNYDYVFAVHEDQHHRHCHIVFNSVNRMDGSKYRYENGDWEKCIQPITDFLCQKRGLEPLTYDKNARKGKSYAEHMAQKHGQMTGKDIIRSDIDHAISKSGDYSEFLDQMRQMGYQIHAGHSDAKGVDYLTFYAPGLGRGRRDYNLGRGYSLTDIQKRITGELDFEPVKLQLPSRLEMQNLWQKNRIVPMRRSYVLRVIYAVMYHSVDPFEVNQEAVRKDLMEIQKLQEECTYLQQHEIENLEQAEDKLRKLLLEEKELKGMGDAEALKVVRAEKKIIRRVVKRSTEMEERKYPAEPAGAIKQFLNESVEKTPVINAPTGSVKYINKEIIEADKKQLS